MLKGILFSLSANILFGAGYYFAVLLRPLESDSIFGFRIVVLMPFILLVIFLFHQQKAFKDLYYRVKQAPYLIFILLLLALNTAIQLGYFFGHRIIIKLLKFLSVIYYYLSLQLL